MNFIAKNQFSVAHLIPQNDMQPCPHTQLKSCPFKETVWLKSGINRLLTVPAPRDRLMSTRPESSGGEDKKKMAAAVKICFFLFSRNNKFRCERVSQAHVVWLYEIIRSRGRG